MSRMASRTAMRRTLVCVVVGLAWLASADTYRGVVIAPENRCTPYDRQDYPYSQSVEQRIVAALGAIYGPYSGACFAHTGQTDIEHMVAGSEAHDSGLCAASGAVKGGFRHRPAEPHAREPERQSAPEKRQGRSRVDAGSQRVLVRRPNARSAPQIRPDDRPR